MDYLKDSDNKNTIKSFFGHIKIDERILDWVKGIELYGNESICSGVITEDISLVIMYPERFLLDSIQEVLIRISVKTSKIYIRFFPLVKLIEVLPLYAKYNNRDDMEEFLLKMKELGVYNGNDNIRGSEIIENIPNNKED